MEDIFFFFTVTPALTSLTGNVIQQNMGEKVTLLRLFLKIKSVYSHAHGLSGYS